MADMENKQLPIETASKPPSRLKHTGEWLWVFAIMSLIFGTTPILAQAFGQEHDWDFRMRSLIVGFGIPLILAGASWLFATLALRQTTRPGAQGNLK